MVLLKNGANKDMQDNKVCEIICLMQWRFGSIYTYIHNSISNVLTVVVSF